MSVDHSADTGSMEQEIARLKRLLEASKLINSSIEGDALYDSILTIARQEMDVERATLFFVDEEKQEIWANIKPENETTEIRLPIGTGIAGTVAVTGESVQLDDAYSDPRFDRSSDERTGFKTRSMLTVPITRHGTKIVGVLQLLNRKLGSFGEEDLRFLQSLSDHMAIAMENHLLHLTLIQKDRMERELQLGREIQTKLLPPPPTNISETEIAAESHSCMEVGGDYYDFIPLSCDDIGIAVGDVSGKGVGAALIMSSLQATLRASAGFEPNLADLGCHLNTLIYQMTKGSKYVTLFFGRYSPESGLLRYFNAGHNPPLLLHADGVQELGPTCIPIGMMRSCLSGEAFVKLEAGSTLLLYTDGCSEATNGEDEELGMERWRELVDDAVKRPTIEVIPQLLESVKRFENGAEPTDDKTLVVVRRMPRGKKE